MSERIAFGVDLGASSVKGVAIEPDGRIKRKERIELQSTDPEQVLTSVVRLARTLGVTDTTATLGVALPGVIDENGRVLTTSAAAPLAELGPRLGLQPRRARFPV